MNRSNFAVSADTQTMSENDAQGAVAGVPDTALTARALVFVAVLCGGVWYLLWKISVYFLVGH